MAITWASASLTYSRATERSVYRLTGHGEPLKFHWVRFLVSSSARVHIFLSTTSVVLNLWQQFDDHPILGALEF